MPREYGRESLGGELTERLRRVAQRIAHECGELGALRLVHDRKEAPDAPEQRRIMHHLERRCVGERDLPLLGPIRRPLHDAEAPLRIRIRRLRVELGRLPAGCGAQQCAPDAPLGRLTVDHLNGTQAALHTQPRDACVQPRLEVGECQPRDRLTRGRVAQ